MAFKHPLTVRACETATSLDIQPQRVITKPDLRSALFVSALFANQYVVSERDCDHVFVSSVWNTVMMLSIRSYRAADAPTLWTLFYHTVREVNCRDYQTDQKAWAPEDFEPQTWQARMDTITPFIAEIEGQIVGYADLQPDGFIDHFFAIISIKGQVLAAH